MQTTGRMYIKKLKSVILVYGICILGEFLIFSFGLTLFHALNIPFLRTQYNLIKYKEKKVF